MSKRNPVTFNYNIHIGLLKEFLILYLNAQIQISMEFSKELAEEEVGNGSMVTLDENLCKTSIAKESSVHLIIPPYHQQPIWKLIRACRVTWKIIYTSTSSVLEFPFVP